MLRSDLSRKPSGALADLIPLIIEGQRQAEREARAKRKMTAADRAYFNELERQRRDQKKRYKLRAAGVLKRKLIPAVGYADRWWRWRKRKKANPALSRWGNKAPVEKV